MLNAMAGELAYLIAPLGLDLRAAHSWSEKNEVCNHLSRLSPGERPNKTELVGAVRTKRQPVPRSLHENWVEISTALPWERGHQSGHVGRVNNAVGKT